VQRIRRISWFLLIGGALMCLAASPPVIGVAQSPATFSMNHATVPGSATLLEGSAIQTNTAPSDITLKSGERVRLAPNSAAVVYHDRITLQAGLAELALSSAYRIDARGLTIGAADAGARVTVSVAGQSAVAVSTRGGNAEVRNSAGLLVAWMHPGDQVRMEPAAADSIQLTGIVRKQGEVYLLEDQTTHVVVELRGAGMQALVGKVTQIDGVRKPGATPSGGASQVVAVNKATVVPPAGGSTNAAGNKPGVSTRTTVAVIGGVAAAATTGGLAFAGTFSGTGPSVSR
jgi:hypothetical protein